MFSKGFLFKVIFGLIGIAAVTGVIYMVFIKPFAPTDEKATIDSIAGSCSPVISFRDNSQNEDEFRTYRWGPNDKWFTLIGVINSSPGKGTQFTYTDTPLPPGQYTYMFSAKNEFGESYSGMVSVIVTSSTIPVCAPNLYKDPATLPVNPIIVSLSIINDCSVRISYRDNSTNEQGLKIFRRDDSFNVINTLGPHAGIPGTYDDNTKLSVGTYGYRIAAYNQNGESTSNYEEIEVTSVCNPTVKFAPTVDALLVPTAQKLSTAACNWQATANVFLRKGPNVGVYDRLVSVEAGQGFPIVGQSKDGKFWAVEISPGVNGYITKSENYSLTSGNCSSVPTLKDPPPPVIEAVPTKKPGGGDNGNPAPTATPCPVGAVCP
jgi:hypothetical protein